MKHKLFLTLALLATLHTPLSTALAQNTVVTYQGLVQSGGEPFTGAGQFKFALLATTNTSAKATATASVSGGAVTAINVTFGGSGYVTPPAVTITSALGGSGASATANISGGAVVSVTVNNGGSGYILGATVTIAVPPPTLAYHTHWSNDGTSVSGSEPTAAVTLPVASGLFTARLGDASVANMTAFDEGLFAHTNLQLRLWLNDGTNGFAALQPPQPLSAAPYALVAGSAASLSGTYGGAVSFTNGANNFSGSGAGLTALNASQLNSGTVPAAVLGNAWKIRGNEGTSAGTHFLGTTDNQPLEFKVNGARALRLEPTAGFPNIIGGADNLINSEGGGVLSGAGHRIFNASDYSIIGGGILNRIQFNSSSSTISGGSTHIIQSNSSFATIPGGSSNSATNYAFAAGRRAKANHTGAFVWADSQNADFASTANNQFNIRASGGVRLSDDTPAISFGTTGRQMINLYDDTYGIGIQTSTMYFRSNSRFSWYDGGTHNATQNSPGTGGTVLMTLTSGGLTVNGTFVSGSDRNTKENIVAVDPRAVLEQVAALPIARWNYKHDQETPHLGPMAQDFYAAFGVGPDDKHIATVDADGVALAAIQGLNQKLADELKQKGTEIAELKQRLEKLERLMNQQNGGAK